MRRQTGVSNRGASGLVVSAIAVIAFATFAGVASAAPSQGSADLRITKADSPDPVSVGGQLTYSISVENRGPDPATGVTVTDVLPKTVDLVSASAPGGQCATQGRKITCTVPGTTQVGPNYGGQPASVTIVVVPRSQGSIRNTASVKG